MVSVQVGAPAKPTAKSVPLTRLAETGVVPSAWNTRAVMLVGAAAHMPPVGAVVTLGRRSVSTVFQAVPAPVFCTFSVNVPAAPRRKVAGPLFCNVRLGATMVIAPLVPGAPLTRLASLPLMLL